MGIKIEKVNHNIPVYDITVEKNANFFGNDILVHNCAEIVEYSDSETTAQCVLHSLPLQKFFVNGKFDWKGLEAAVSVTVKALNKVIDINKYTSKQAKKGAEEQRALAIGVQGLADLFAEMGISFTSDEAKKWNKDIFEAIYFYALKASNEQAKAEGRVYKYFDGSPASEGILQWHMWGLTEEDLSGRFDWSNLIKSIKKYGLLNSLVTGLMPTASCQFVDSEILLADGTPISFRDILINDGNDVDELENTNEQHWIFLKSPIEVKTTQGNEIINKIKYNGHVETFDIVMEDDTIFKATGNHKFLVNRNGSSTFIKVFDLEENDDIINIFE